MRYFALVLLVSTGTVLAQEEKVVLKDAPGRDKAMQCLACHSLDYIQMNSHFLDKSGWTASVNKMINAFGAPIAKEDVDAIATYLAEKYDANAVLINPAIDPHVGLRAFLGPQKNLHTGERYTLTEAHLEQWEKLYVPRITPGRYLLIVETDDEVLDYRRAVARYEGAEQRVIPGGDHSLQSFPEHLARILEFARAAAL